MREIERMDELEAAIAESALARDERPADPGEQG